MNSAIGKINESLFLNLVSYVYSATILITINIIFVQLYINHKTISILFSTFQKNILNSNISTLSFYICSILLIFILMFIGETMIDIFNLILTAQQFHKKNNYILKYISNVFNNTRFFNWMIAGDINKEQFPSKKHTSSGFQPKDIIEATRNGMKLDKIEFANTNARILFIGIFIDITILCFVYHIFMSLFLIILLIIEVFKIRITNTVRIYNIKDYKDN